MNQLIDTLILDKKANAQAKRLITSSLDTTMYNLIKNKFVHLAFVLWNDHYLDNTKYNEYQVGLMLKQTHINEFFALCSDILLMTQYHKDKGTVVNWIRQNIDEFDTEMIEINEKVSKKANEKYKNYNYTTNNLVKNFSQNKKVLRKYKGWN